jgi:hypothetical protein
MFLSNQKKDWDSAGTVQFAFFQVMVMGLVVVGDCTLAVGKAPSTLG